MSKWLTALVLTWLWAGGAVAQAPAPSTSEAFRFLTQATFGPTDEDVAHLKAVGLAGWVTEQLQMPPSETYVSLGQGQLKARGKRSFFNAFWKKAITAPDQLRQRMALALSEIFVVSLADACGADHGFGFDDYQDMLARDALGSYRQLLEDVTRHPIMGCYLSHLKNRREEASSGRTPDENYAREVMQLFSIGLVALNPDGTPRLDRHGEPIETYGPADVTGLARVFTGWSWACPTWPSDECFQYRGTARRETGGDPWTQPMVPYGKFHAWQEKRFLGVRIPEQNNPDAVGDLKVALDTLAHHPNVAPFIGRQLIQRLVTSNPSPAYVKRVSQVFTATQGNLGAVARAILLDPDARATPAFQTTAPSHPLATFGKVREPVLGLSALLRAFHAQSFTGDYSVGDTHQAAKGLNQAPGYAPSVFNFFRPGYVPPGSATARAGLGSPEMQLMDETSMAGQARLMFEVTFIGLGEHTRQAPGQHPADVKLEYQVMPSSELMRLAMEDPPKLVALVNQRLLNGQMSETLASTITSSLSGLRQPLQRVSVAVFLTVISPEFMIQH